MMMMMIICVMSLVRCHVLKHKDLAMIATCQNNRNSAVGNNVPPIKLVMMSGNPEIYSIASQCLS